MEIKSSCITLNHTLSSLDAMFFCQKYMHRVEHDVPRLRIEEKYCES